jgi:ABC-type transport system substrate-binding protein
LGEAMKIAQEDLPYVPMWTRTQAVAISNRFVFDEFTPPPDVQFWVNHIRAV